MRAALIGASAVALAIAAGPTASAQNVPSKDAFNGTIAPARRHSARDRGKLAIVLATPAEAQVARALTLTFRGRDCGGRRRCRRLTGSLTGSLTRVFNGNPDTGSSFTVRAVGRLKPLGHVSARGIVRGPGFIAQGRMTMSLTLTTTAGKMTVTAQSGLVPGFTSP